MQISWNKKHFKLDVCPDWTVHSRISSSPWDIFDYCNTAKRSQTDNVNNTNVGQDHKTQYQVLIDDPLLVLSYPEERTYSVEILLCFGSALLQWGHREIDRSVFVCRSLRFSRVCVRANILPFPTITWDDACCLIKGHLISPHRWLPW